MQLLHLLVFFNSVSSLPLSMPGAADKRSKTDRALKGRRGGMCALLKGDEEEKGEREDGKERGRERGRGFVPIRR